MRWTETWLALVQWRQEMHDLSFVMQRIAAGDRVYFAYDYYGQTLITLSRGRFFKRKTQVKLPPDEVAQVRAVLRARRQGKTLAA